MQDQAIVQALAQTLYDRKACDIVALNVSKLTVLCDYMLLASGRTARQVAALYDALGERAAELGLTLHRSEGQTESRWIVLDYGHLMVHLFHQEERAYYNLERLWEDGDNRVPLPFDQTVETLS